MGGDLDQETRQGDTALMLATAACNTEAVKLLLHHGVMRVYECTVTCDFTQFCGLIMLSFRRISA